jgi:hypothetical protein
MNMNVFGLEEDTADKILFQNIEQEIKESQINKPIFSYQDIIPQGKDNSIKYVNLIDAFFNIKEACMRGELGVNHKGEHKLLLSIERFAKVFLLRFYNSRPQFYSFKKAGIGLETLNLIPYGLRFDIEEVFGLLEPTTKLAWNSEIESSYTIFSSTQEIAEVTCNILSSKLLPLQAYYCLRRLFTYETDRAKPSIDYAPLTESGAILPNWFLHFKQGHYEKLGRKEQAIAYLNDYNTRYKEVLSLNPSAFNYIEDIRPTTEEVKIHKMFSWKAVGSRQ